MDDPQPDSSEGGGGTGNTLVAATYASGHLRVWNYANSTCVGQVRISIFVIWRGSHATIKIFSLFP